MPVTRTSPDNPLAPIQITHSSGSCAVVYPYGATLTSFMTASNRELFFVSPTAIYDGSKAIRGGIPLCFPQFGQPDTSYPQHGFARRNLWTLSKEFECEESGAACCEFSLRLKDATVARGGKWASDTKEYDCSLSLLVKVEAERIITLWSVANTGGVSFPYQALFHTYYKIEGSNALKPNACCVTGLSGYTVQDKVTNEKEYIQGEEPIVVDREVDRIYRSTNPSKQVLDVFIRTGLEIGVRLVAEAKANGGRMSLPVSVVVWNPHVAKSKTMSDFPDEAYHDMICVEPGILHNISPLAKGDVISFQQTISSVQTPQGK